MSYSVSGSLINLILPLKMIHHLTGLPSEVGFFIMTSIYFMIKKNCY